MSLTQSWKRCSWGSSGAKTRVSVQSVHSMMELNLAEHLAGFSPSVQSVVPYGCEQHEWMQGSICPATGEPGAWHPRKKVKSELSFVQQFKHSSFTPLQWPCLFWLLTCSQVWLTDKHLPMSSRPYWGCIYSPFPSPSYLQGTELENVNCSFFAKLYKCMSILFSLPFMPFLLN